MPPEHCDSTARVDPATRATDFLPVSSTMSESNLISAFVEPVSAVSAMRSVMFRFLFNVWLMMKNPSF
jgi:hypothetical protein